MKRLVDESTDELTRSLLSAGIEHRPAPGNKAQVIVALGAGSAIGLFGSNAFAWLGTTAGKITAAGVAVGVAGALFVVAPELDRGAGAHAAAGSNGAARARSAALAAPSPAVLAPAVPVEALGSSASAAGALAPASQEPSSIQPTSGALPLDAPEAASASDKAATKKLSRWRERRLAVRRSAALSGSALSSAAKARQAAPSPASDIEPESGSVPPIAAAASASGQERLAVALPDLDSEVRLVDDMHGAARRNDREALGRFLARYRETFPEGQLRKEVAEFAARLQQASESNPELGAPEPTTPKPGPAEPRP